MDSSSAPRSSSMSIGGRGWRPANLMIVLGGVLFLALTSAGLVNPLHADTISPRRLLEVADLGNPGVSPDGRMVAYRLERASVARNTYDTYWYVQAVDGESAPLRVAEGGVPLRQYVNGQVLPAPAVWSPEGRWIYYRALIDGKVSVWRAATDGSRAEAITQDAADVRQFFLSSDGQTLRYSVGATREEVLEAELNEYDRGIRIDESTFIGAGLLRSSRLQGRSATQRFVGDWFTTGPLLADVPDRWRVVELSSRTTRELTPVDSPNRRLDRSDPGVDLPTFSMVVTNPDDKRLAVLFRDEEERAQVDQSNVSLAVLPDRNSNRSVVCAAELCTGKNITDLQWRPGSDEVLFTVTQRSEGRAQSIMRWNVVTGGVHRVVQARGLLRGSSRRHHDVPCGISSAAIICVTTEADRPPRLERIDIETGQRIVLFDPNAALALDIATTTPARLIRWTDVRGREFTGQLFEARTESAEPAPLFVTFYTCDGFLRGGLGDEWPLAPLAAQGISSLCVNGLPGHHPDVAEHYGQGQLAVESAVELLAEAGAIDPTKIGMGGLSYGSEVTLWTLMHSDVLAAASVSGVSVTPTYYLFNSLRDSFRSVLDDLWQLGAPDDTPDQWRAISPAFNLEKIEAPVLFQMPEQEYLMVLDYALPLVRKSIGEIYVFPEEAHVKFQPRHKLAAYQRNLDWFRFWLQGYENADPRKAQQYEHWRIMRLRQCERMIDEGGAVPWYC